MAWYDEILKSLGGAVGTGLGAMGMGALGDLLGLGGKETPMPQMPGRAPQLEQTPAQTPQLPQTPYTPPAPPPARKMRFGYSPNIDQAMQQAIGRYLKGGM